TDFEMNCRSASSTTLGPSESHTFAVIPSTVYPTSAIVADSSAQGSWVITCTIWLQPAPVDDSIVESEIGEQWSPKTEPARIAAIAGSRRSVRSIEIMISPAIGISMPKDPQLVPVATAIRHATANTTAGSRLTGRLDCWTTSPSSSPVPIAEISSPIIHANVSTSIAGNIAINPVLTPSHTSVLPNSLFLRV